MVVSKSPLLRGARKANLPANPVPPHNHGGQFEVAAALINRLLPTPPRARAVLRPLAIAVAAVAGSGADEYGGRLDQAD
jgi:hypothetical protein